MRRRRLLRVWAVAATLAVACDEPLPPPIPVREPSLDADDMTVVKALFDDLLRPKWREAIRTGGAPEWPLRFLVVDRTMAMCRLDPLALGPPPGRCLSHSHAGLVSEVVPADVLPTVKLRFAAWNATPLSMTGPLGDDIAYVSPTFLDMMSSDELLQRSPAGRAALVTLGAPGYPAPGMAVISFESWFAAGGAARLERQAEGRWRVVASASRPRD